MEECTNADRPLVSIVMAVYKPNIEWLIQQLESLDNQTYSNLELIIWDDCPTNPVDEAHIKNTMQKLRYTLIRGEKNLGSTLVFEELTKLANGKYIAYCDQDDIWCDDKLELMVEVLEKTGSPLVYADMSVMNGKSEKVADSILEVYTQMKFRQGEGLAQYLIVHNFVTGCDMMITAEMARKALPFQPMFIHDQWLAIYASLHGSIDYIDKPLIRYRKHGNNQTGVLQGVNGKQSYYEIRLVEHKKRMELLSERLASHSEVKEVLEQLRCVMEARVRYYNRPSIRDWKMMCQYRGFFTKAFLMESVMKLVPDFVFKKIVKTYR
ncbi:MAG: glycosyltransferase family 2 protein [Eubacteriales bacterium]